MTHLQTVTAGRARRNFNIFWAGQTLSALGDAVAMVALPLVVLEATGSVAQMGTLSAIGLAGTVVAGLMAGLVVDRFDRRRLMILCDCMRAILWGAVPIVWMLGGPRIGVLAPIAFFGGLFGHLFQLACLAAIPRLVPREELPVANSRVMAGFSVMYLAGPMLAGLVSKQAGPVTALGIDASTFALSALSVFLIRIEDTVPVDRVATSWQSDLLAGFRFVWRHPTLRALVVLSACANFFIASRVDLYVYAIKTMFHRSDNTVGIFFGMASVGAIVGSLLAPAMVRRFGFGIAWLGATALSGLCMVGIGLFPRLEAAFGFGILSLLIETARVVFSTTYRQQVTPDAVAGRVSAVCWLAVNSLAPPGAAFTAALGGAIGVAPAIASIGFATVILAALGALSALRTERRAAAMERAAGTAAEVSVTDG